MDDAAGCKLGHLGVNYLGPYLNVQSFDMQTWECPDDDRRRPALAVEIRLSLGYDA